MISKMSKQAIRKANGAYKRAIRICKHLAGYKCGICGTDYSNHPNRTMLLEGDHIIPLKNGGARLDQKNLWALCGRLTTLDCHRKRHIEQGTAVRGSVKGYKRNNKKKRTRRQ